MIDGNLLQTQRIFDFEGRVAVKLTVTKLKVPDSTEIERTASFPGVAPNGLNRTERATINNEHITIFYISYLISL